MAIIQRAAVALALAGVAGLIISSAMAAPAPINNKS